MKEITDRPLVCLTIAFAAGIAAAARQGVAGVVVVCAITLAAAGGCALRKRRAWVGVALLGVGAAAGAALWNAAGHAPFEDVSHLPPGGQTLVGTVAGPPRYLDGVWRFVLSVESHENGVLSESVGGRVHVRLSTTQSVTRGQRWRLTGRLRDLRPASNPGQQSEASRLASLGVTGVLTVGTEELAELLGPGRLGAVASHAYRAQRRALATLERFVSGPYRELTAAVAAGVIFGVHSAPPAPEITEAFRRAGTIHLLVVSGAMVSTLFGLVFLPGLLGAGWRRMLVERQSPWPLSGRGRVKLWPRMGAAVLAVVAVTYYAVLTEGGQAVTRAAIMGILAGLSLGLRRVPRIAREHGLNVDHYTLLSVGALAILAAQPSALFQPGFQLSFVAVAAIIYLTPKAEPLMAGLPRWLRLGVAATVAAQLATFPILVWHYGQVPVVGLAANLLAVPLAGVILVAGMATCALGVVAPWAAPMPGWLAGVCARWMVQVSSFFAAPAWAAPEVAKPGLAVVLAWYAGLVALGWVLARVRFRGLGA